MFKKARRFEKQGYQNSKKISMFRSFGIFFRLSQGDNSQHLHQTGDGDVCVLVLHRTVTSGI